MQLKINKKVEKMEKEQLTLQVLNSSFCICKLAVTDKPP